MSTAGSFVPSKGVSSDMSARVSSGDKDLIPDAPQGGASQDAGTRTRAGAPVVKRLGKVLISHDPRKWGNFDMSRGVQARVPYGLTRDDRMSPEEARAKTEEILKMYGIEGANEGEQLAFLRGMFLHFAVNSASVLQPGRAGVTVAGTKFDMHHVVAKLGPDLRRYARAYADEIQLEIRRCLDTYDAGDPASVEVVSWITQIAVDRGLQRFPWLIHDSASACTNLTLVEAAAVARSSNLVLSTSINAADAMSARAGPVSADQFDSTNGARVPGAVTDRATRY